MRTLEERLQRLQLWTQPFSFSGSMLRTLQARKRWP
jgi:hypothetical protein